MAIVTRDDLLHSDVTVSNRPKLGSRRTLMWRATTRVRPRMLINPEVTAKWMWIGFAVLGIILLAYLVSLLVRPPTEEWTWLDGWTVCGIEVVASMMCIARGLEKHPGRAAPLALGFALLSWSIGDVLLTFESLGAPTPPTPSWADLFYIGFYPLAYVATVQLLRKAIGRLATELARWSGRWFGCRGGVRRVRFQRHRARGGR